MKKFIILAISCLLLSIVCGHFNRNELNEIAIVYAVGIDKSEKGYKISMQIINPKLTENSSNEQPPVIVYQDEAKSIGKAIEKVSKKISREIHLSQIQLILIGETLIKNKGIEAVLNYVLRDPKMASVVDILVTKDIEAAQALQVASPLEDIPINEVVKILKNTAENWGSHQRMFPTQLKAEFISEGKEAAISTLKIIGDSKNGKNQNTFKKLSPNSYLALSGLTIFRGNKPVGWLNDNLSRTYYSLKGALKTTYFDAPCSKKEEFGLRILKNKTAIKGHLKNGVPYFQITVRFIGDLNEFNCEMDVSNPKVVKKLELKMEKEIKRNVESLLQTSKKLKSDVIGFGETLMIYDNSNWKKIKSNWNKIYPISQFDIDIQILIRNQGDMYLHS
ncbi:MULTISPECIES: Ger(x)C family spore germination protein [Bacillus cereus group]|uniref:Ger(x)C family spore germination protein n=1 Tax=Bacillus TaxID=1386 RepID=UPI0001A1D21E|nr:MULTISPECIES: Ger(x)C family spore germination protein [Bacillus cereus group]EEM68673.1 Spore germination protein KC [Bacillus thuringiensis serovar andalousiensis BGSC 4AW1]MEB9631806.1 Ger(x)C family spore germination protein [Bacillus anthracis]